MNKGIRTNLNIKLKITDTGPFVTFAHRSTFATFPVPFTFVLLTVFTLHVSEHLEEANPLKRWKGWCGEDRSKGKTVPHMSEVECQKYLVGAWWTMRHKRSKAQQFANWGAWCCPDTGYPIKTLFKFYKGSESFKYDWLRKYTTCIYKMNYSTVYLELCTSSKKKPKGHSHSACPWEQSQGSKRGEHRKPGGDPSTPGDVREWQSWRVNILHGMR